MARRIQGHGESAIRAAYIEELVSFERKWSHPGSALPELLGDARTGRPIELDDHLLLRIFDRLNDPRRRTFGWPRARANRTWVLDGHDVLTETTAEAISPGGRRDG